MNATIQFLAPISELFEQITGRRPSPNAITRWSLRGVKGIILDTWRVGHYRRTTEQAVLDFTRALALVDHDAQKPSKPILASEYLRQREIAVASK